MSANMDYIITYRYLVDEDKGIWKETILPVGFKTLEAAQGYIRKQPAHPSRCTNWYYQTEDFCEYYIKEVTIKEV